MKIGKNNVGIILFVAFLVSGIFIFFAINIYILPKVKYQAVHKKLQATNIQITTILASGELEKLVQKEKILSRKIEKLTPGSSFLIINTTENTFSLFQKNELIRKGKCSTGSFVHLEVDSTKSYFFETPKGALSVKGKITNPVWRKPDWAFIEEGLPVPPANHASRYEKNVLGDYALSLGNGYLIHGTLYQRLLGLPVTHGCIRLNDADLEAVYHALEVGSKVFIY